MKQILTQIDEVYVVYSKKITDGAITVMWVETDKEEAQLDAEKYTDNEYRCFFTCEKVYGTVFIKKFE